jgi:hypothetical protein
VQQAEPYAAAFIGRLPPPGGAPSDADMLIVRHRFIGDGMREDIIVRNTARLSATLLVMLTAEPTSPTCSRLRPDWRSRPRQPSRPLRTRP